MSAIFHIGLERIEQIFRCTVESWNDQALIGRKIALTGGDHVKFDIQTVEGITKTAHYKVVAVLGRRCKWEMRKPGQGRIIQKDGNVIGLFDIF